MPSVPGYIYAMNRNGLYVNLFIGSTAYFNMDGNEISLQQETAYPWEGKIKLTVHSPDVCNFKLFIRLPGWASNQVVPSALYTFLDNKKIKQVSIKVNNRKVDYDIVNGYAVIEQTWGDNDEIIIDIPMEIRRIVANKKVKADRGNVAYQRGPLVYCLEGVDNSGNVLNAVIDPKDKIEYTFMPGLLNGTGVLYLKGQQICKEDKPQTKDKKVRLMAIPYYAWDNRGTSSMTVWVPEGKN